MIRRIVSWNLRGFTDGSGKFSPEPALRALQALDADVFALQEVEDRNWNGMPALSWLAAEGGWHFWAGPTLLRGDFHYGNAVLARQPAAVVRRHEFATSRAEPRGLLDIEFGHESGRVRLMATHLGLGRRERRRQLDAILSIAGEPVPGRIDILAGDFNEWLPRSALLSRLDEAFGRGTRGATFPACWPVFGLDRIWVRPAGMLRAFEVGRLAHGESDHLPVIASLR